MKVTGVWPKSGHRLVAEGIQISEEIELRDKTNGGLEKFQILYSKRDFRQLRKIVTEAVKFNQLLQD